VNPLASALKQKLAEVTETREKTAMEKAAKWDRIEDVMGIVREMYNNRSVSPEDIFDKIGELMDPDVDLVLVRAIESQKLATRSPHVTDSVSCYSPIQKEASSAGQERLTRFDEAVLRLSNTGFSGGSNAPGSLWG